MAEPPRDWDRELADIDRLIASGGTAPAGKPAPRPAAASAAGTAVRPPSGKVAIFATWFRVLLAGALVAALVVWPFARACGTGLALYLASIALGVVTSLWAVAASWTHRRGFAHVMGLLLLLGTLVFGAAEILPRTGYAKASSTWLCTAPPAASMDAPSPTSGSTPGVAPTPATVQATGALSTP